MNAPLLGQCIVNTRPLHQQQALNDLLEHEGARVIAFPAIEIVECEATEFHRSLAQNIEHYHVALFVSRNAVDGAFRFLNTDNLPEDLQLGVIGEGTCKALEQRVVDLYQRLIVGYPYNSEGLLACSELQAVAGKNVLIFRGQQGRNLLGEELRARDAKVSYCEVYTRRVPEYNADAFDQLIDEQLPTLAVFTSNEGMSNAMTVVGQKASTKLLPWILISERMRESAVNLGHNGDILIAANATDSGIHQAIVEWASEQSV